MARNGSRSCSSTGSGCMRARGAPGSTFQRERLRADGARVARRRRHRRGDAGERRSVAGFGIDAVVDHYAQAIGGLEPKPIAIGHSFGGLIVQRLLGQGLAVRRGRDRPGADQGRAGASAVGAARWPRSRCAARRTSSKAVSLTREQFRYGFGNALSEQESNELFDRWAIPSPGLPLFEAAFAAFSPHSPAKVDTRNSTRGPLLVTAGGKDHTVPPAISRSTVKLYRHSSAVTEHREFPDRGHSLTIDSGWRDVADAVLHWLKEKGL